MKQRKIIHHYQSADDSSKTHLDACYFAHLLKDTGAYVILLNC